MRKILRITGWVIACIVLPLVAILGFSAFRYWSEMSIDPSRGVNEAGYVHIGGIDQWIQIRGEDRNNPVLLWLNGGPGFSTIPSTWLVRPWEKYFTIVMWDQRGEGKTFAKLGEAGSGDMTVEQMTQDGIDLAGYLRDRLDQKKIVLFGHSWGTILGVRMARQRPDLVAAYVATGQVTNTVSSMTLAYPRLVARAQLRANQAAERELTSIGSPPYDDLGKYWVCLTWANVLDPGSRPLPRDWGVLWAFATNVLGDRGVRPGAQFSQRVMFGAVMHTDLPALGDRFEVPILMIQGSEDLVTVASLAKQYFDKIDAPRKDFVLLAGDGHTAVARDRQVFLTALVNHLRPLLARSDWPRKE